MAQPAKTRDQIAKMANSSQLKHQSRWIRSR